MNRVQLLGRLTKDPELRYTTGENANAFAKFTVAVNRKGRDQGADFIPCTAFGKQAEFIVKYFQKGSMICIDDGRINTGSYTNKDGQKVFTTDVIVSSVEFAGSKNSGSETGRDESFMSIPDGADEALPFN